LPDRRAASPEDAEGQAPGVRDGLVSLDPACQASCRAFCRRASAGETAGYLRFQGRTRCNGGTSPQEGHGAALDGGVRLTAFRATADGGARRDSPPLLQGRRAPCHGPAARLPAHAGAQVAHARGQVAHEGGELACQAAAAQVPQPRHRSSGAAAQAQQLRRRWCTDVQHQTALALRRTCDTITLDDVWRVATLVRTRPLATSSADAG
jgi:hypothetical protein